ncbi:hypothetical protein HYQ45_008525 [Verticillium longisporum]|uniref:Uncharacterized protein n=1 Tax=Verticillium longisporum TaxID=100787 RepID=A0A8I3AP58_VERLO|nr:hypothetical protein HYQ45_008525 [Verticillium longisporum]RBQ99125.1 hypothetical protein VDGD_07261 [Verticillium dahliae]
MKDETLLTSLAQSRLDYKRKGYTFVRLQEQSRDNSSSELADMRRQAMDTAASQGKPPSMWKSLEEVEVMLKSHMTEDEIVRMSAVAQGHGTDEDAYLFSIIVISLANHFICFGDGPRWDAVFVSLAVGGWLKVLQDPAEPKSWDKMPSSQYLTGPDMGGGIRQHQP